MKSSSCTLFTRAFNKNWFPKLHNQGKQDYEEWNTVFFSHFRSVWAGVCVCKWTKVSEREPFEPIKTFPKPNFMYYVLRIFTVPEWREKKRKRKRGDPNGFHFKRFTGKKVRKREKRRNEGITQRMKRAVSKAKVKVEKKIIVRNTFSTINFELLNTRQQPRQQRMNEPTERKKLQRICEKEMCLLLAFKVQKIL